MFTGLVESKGKVVCITQQGVHLQLEIEHEITQIQLGDSIAVEGVCLTAKPLNDNRLMFDVSEETLAKTTVSSFQIGQYVNLEQALFANARMGGHYVSGHVDKTAVLHGFEPCDNYVKMQIDGFAEDDLKYLIPKGSITVNGVSLTINAVNDTMIEIMLVPHTLAATTLSLLQPRQLVNIEFDYFGKIIAHQLQSFLQHQHALKDVL